MDDQENKAFCVLPWVHRLVDITGEIKDCCLVPDVDGHISNWEESWNNERIKKVRREMVEGTRRHQCDFCYGKEDAGKGSARTYYNSVYMGDPEVAEIVAESVRNDYHVDAKPKFIELRFGSLCNLRCKMCSGHYSSTIRKDAAQLKEIDPEGYQEHYWKQDRFIDMPEDWYLDERAMKNLDDIIPHIQEVHFSGGEPTLAPQYTQFLKRCVDQGYAKNIKIDISTNITNIKMEMLDLLVQFKKPRIQCSIDGVGDTYDYLRAPAHWDKVRENLITLMKLTKTTPLELGISMVLQVFNLLDLPEAMQEFADLYDEHCAQGEGSNFLMRVTCITYPYKFTIDRAPAHIRALGLSRLNDWLANNTMSQDFAKGAIEFGTFEMIQHQLMNPDEENTVTCAELYNYCRFTDQNKKVTLETHIPELHRMLVEGNEQGL